MCVTLQVFDIRHKTTQGRVERTSEENGCDFLLCPRHGGAQTTATLGESLANKKDNVVPRTTTLTLSSLFARVNHLAYFRSHIISTYYDAIFAAFLYASFGQYRNTMYT